MKNKINHKGLKYKTGQLWKLKKVEMIPVVIEASRTATKWLNNCTLKMNLQLSIGMPQKFFLGTSKFILKG